MVGIQGRKERVAAKKQIRVIEGDLMRTLLSRKPFLSLEKSVFLPLHNISNTYL